MWLQHNLDIDYLSCIGSPFSAILKIAQPQSCLTWYLLTVLVFVREQFDDQILIMIEM
jgi:hypothetical protein